MQFIKLFEKSVSCVVALLIFGGAYAVESTHGGRGSMMPVAVSSVPRMPTMPVVSMNTVGNPAVKTINTPAEVVAAQNVAPIVTPIPTPTPKPEPEPDEPTPVQECPDGGVKNSAYTVSMCMDDLKKCINTGALQGGMNDLFNEDVRNAIFGGMKICQPNIDKCIAEVRVNCRNIYNEKNDVWLDFNSRVIQPDYYNFVLRKTGLTPHQAENTCLLLDRNTFGNSFAAVSDLDLVRAEYQKNLGAYNSARHDTLSKDNPLGVEVNTIGYDGKRGHYARWDASNAECLLRVGAYNKNNAIKNSWLFGAVGNDNVAEVWKSAGSTFTCNKDLFGFSLLNDTKTAAVVGIVGGTVVGAGVGAGIGAAVYNSKKQEADAAKLAANADPCKDSDYRDTLGTKVMSGGNNGRVDTYLYTSVTLNNDGEIDTSSSTKMFADRDFYNMSEDKCHAIHDLYAKAKKYEDAIANCEANKNNLSIAAMLAKVSKRSPTYEKLYVEEKNGKKVLMYGEVNCGPLDSSLTATDVELFSSQCLFVPLQLGFVVDNPDMPFCNHNGQCKDVQQIKIELSRLQSLLKEIEPAVARSVIDGAKKGKKLSKGAEIGKGLAIGAGVGAGVGGLATAITAFVERNNITCKVGDGLNSVGLGKSHTIDSLKNFYVKWNLKLPDTVVPTSEVIDRESWDQACTQFNSKLYDCPNVQINFKKNGKYEIIPSACKISGNLCIRNYAVSASHEID